MKRVLLAVISILVLLVSCAAPPPQELMPEPTSNLPSVASLSLWKAPAGTEVEIIGSNFFSMRFANEVRVGNLMAPIVYASEDELKILIPPVEPGQVSLLVRTPEGRSSEVTFEVLPLPQPTLPVGRSSESVLQLLDELLLRLMKEPAGRELTKEIEEARYFLLEAKGLLPDAEEERVQAVDTILSNAKVEQGLRELSSTLEGTPHVTVPSITAIIGAVAGFSQFLIGIFVIPVAPPIGVALITMGAVEGVAGIVGAIYSINDDLERQQSQPSDS